MKVKELLTEKTWIKGMFACDSEGLSVNVNDPNACRWCLYGAIAHCYGTDTYLILERLSRCLGGSLQHHVTDYNDQSRRVWSEVLDLIVEFDL